MRKILTIFLLSASTAFAVSEEDYMLIESLKSTNPFSAFNYRTTPSGIGSAQMLSLRGITKIGTNWYFSIYDSSINSSFWVQLKDEDRDDSLIKADFFDAEQNNLEISTASYTHTLALKEQDAPTGPMPKLAGTKTGYTRSRNPMYTMMSRMNSSQKASMALHMAASMLQENSIKQKQLQYQQQKIQQQTKATNYNKTKTSYKSSKSKK